MGLKEKALKGIFWTLLQQVGVQGVNFVVQIVLARLLLPEDFGLIALIQIFILIGNTLLDSGMTSSLIRSDSLREEDYSTVFFTNIFISIFIYIVLFISSPYIADYFKQDVLVSVIRIFSLSLIIQAFGAVQITILTKELKFKKQMLMQIPSIVIGGCVGIILAYKGYGVWSIVYMQLLNTFCYTSLNWIFNKWKPKFIFDFELFKVHFNFGYKLTLSSLITTLYNNVFTLIIAKLFSATQLGFYNQANNMRMYPVTNITSALQKVTYPLFSKIKDDNERLKLAFIKITKIVFFVMAPSMFFLSGISKSLFHLLLTDKWDNSIYIFQLLCLASIFYPQSIYNLNIITSKGRSDIFLKLELYKKIISLSFLVLIIPFGFIGVVYAKAMSLIIHYLLNAYVSGNLINYKFKYQLLDLLPVFLISSISLLILKGSEFYFVYMYDSDLITIILSIIIYFGSYLFLSIILKISAFNIFKELIFSITKKI